MDRIAAHAKELLAAQNSAIFLPDADGQRFRAIVALGDLADTLKATAVDPGRGIIGSLIASGQPEFVNDSAADARAIPIPGTPLQHDERLMVVPLKSGEQVQGAMAVWRSGGSPFEARELGFLEGLSQQAVIALNNARLFDQTQAALQRQTASADILRVISQSPTDVMPVADVIVATARRLLGCYRTAFLRREGDVLIALRHATAEGVLPGFFGRIPLDPAHNFPSRAFASRLPLHLPDWSKLELNEHEREVQRNSGCLSSLMLPLLRGADQEPLGVLVFQRDTPTAFSEPDIALAQSFADQAVIAIENVRLFNETREALERQTATAEILKVIAQSPGDVQPVLDAIVASAKRLVDGYSATVWQLDGELLRLTAFTQTGEQAARALQRFSDGLVVGDAFAMDPLRTGLPIQMADVLTDPRATEEHRELARVRGFHAVTNVPLVREGLAIGMISVTRVEAGEFTPHQIELLQTFADQAVIAIENVRLFNETREALERQTATAEVLQRHQRLADRHAAGVRHHRAERQRSCSAARRRFARSTATGFAGRRRVTRRAPSSTARTCCRSTGPPSSAGPFAGVPGH